MKDKYKLNKTDINRLIKDLQKPIDDASHFFTLLGAKYYQWTDLTFKHSGQRGRHNRWVGFSQRTLHPSYIASNGELRINTKQWRNRIGTDGTVSKYSSSSKLLDASGGYRQSFNIIKQTKKQLTFGTNHQIRGVIGAEPERQVLQIDDADRTEIKNMFRKYVVDSYRSK